MIQTTGYRLQDTDSGYRLQDTDYMKQTTGYRLYETDYRIHTIWIQII